MDTVLELLGLIYDAAADASRWQNFLDAFVPAIRGRRAVLSIHDPKRSDFAAVCWSGWSPEDVRIYMEKYIESDLWWISSTSLPEGAVYTDSEFCSRREVEATLAFQEFYGARDCVNGIGGMILVTPTGRSMITLVRGIKDGPFGEPEKQLLSAVLPHLRRAALLHGELGSIRSQLAAFTGHLDRYPHAFLLTDGERRVLYANAAARDLAERKDGIAMEAGQISLGSPRQDAVFREAFDAMASGRDVAVRRMEVSRPSRKTPYRFLIMPAHASGFMPLGVALPSIMVLIVDDESQPEPDLTVLRELFSLTPAEARVTAKLAQGRNVDEIASKTGVSVATVRSHIKQTLSKTGTDRQGELISLVLRSVPFRQP